VASPNQPARRIAAILNADVVGYSKLMASDEAGTLRALHAQRARLRREIEAHGGRVIDAVGDNLLAEFPSAVNALTSAVAAQRALSDVDSQVPEERRLCFRIGLHLGDVVVDGDGIAGDGVNIAARIQAQADPGGVALSGALLDQVEGKVDVAFESLGERVLKNLPKPVRVYRIRIGEQRPRVAEPVARAAADGPSIAVLPFENLSADPEQDYLAEGIAEELITRLVGWNYLRVVARTSSFAFKGRKLDAREIARELGARFIVEGSVRRSGERIRLTVQLIDGSSGDHVWAERWDREAGDVFALEDEIVSAIVRSLPESIGTYEERRTLRQDPASLDAWDSLVRAGWLHRQETPEDWAAALKLAQASVARDPSLPRAWAILANLHCTGADRGWAEDRERSVAAALDAARSAIALDLTEGYGHTAQGLALLLAGQAADSLTAFERALALRPNSPSYLTNLGMCLYVSGRADEAVVRLEEVLQMGALGPLVAVVHAHLAGAHFSAGRDEAAARHAEQALAARPFPLLPRLMAAAAAIRGEPDEAKRWLEGLPSERLSELRRRMAYVHPSLLDRLCEGLKLAGVPD